MFPPKNLFVPSDDNELQYISTNKKGDMYVYVYKKSITKLNTEISFSDVELRKLLSNEIFTKIE